GVIAVTVVERGELLSLELLPAAQIEAGHAGVGVFVLRHRDEELFLLAVEKPMKDRLRDQRADLADQNLGRSLVVDVVIWADVVVLDADLCYVSSVVGLDDGASHGADGVDAPLPRCLLRCRRLELREWLGMNSVPVKPEEVRLVFRDAERLRLGL